jgi:hypothetical protein
LKLSEYIKTEQGQAYLYGERKLKRIYAWAAQEPRSKQAFKALDKRAFQEEASRWMDLLELTPLRGPVVVDMTFDPVQSNPPSIEKLPKSYLDLLERQVGEDGSFTNKRLVFRDDRQVKILMARYNLGLSTSSQVAATITPRRHFLADLELVRRIERGDFEETRNQRYGRWRDTGDREKLFGIAYEDEIQDALENLRGISRWSQDYRDKLGEGIYEQMRLFYQHRAQQALLAYNDQFIGSLLLDLPELWKRRPRDWLLDFTSQSRHLLVSRPLSFSVGHAPRRDGDRAQFAEALQRALVEFTQNFPILFPLHTQLGVTIFHIPPQTGTAGTYGKDLDNLARLIIPKVQEVCKPPSTVWHAHQTFAGSSLDPRISEWNRKEAELHRRIPAVAVSRYCAIELPRVLGDPPDGEVAIAFGDGQQIDSLWDQIDRFVDDWKNGLPTA